MGRSRQQIAELAQRTSPFLGGGGAEHNRYIPDKVDADGVLLELTNAQIERMQRADILDYQARRKAQLDAKAQEAREQDDLNRYKEAFVAAGGREAEAEAAYYRQRDREAERAANEAEAQALAYSRRNVRRSL